MGKGNEPDGLAYILETRIKQSFSLDKLLCFFSVEVESHVSKKNRSAIFRNRASGRAFFGKDKVLKNAEERLIFEFKMQRIQQGITDPISVPVWMISHFYFPRSVFYTKKNEISMKLPDLSNLLQMPEDCLQSAHVLLNDTLIHSHDLSRRLPAEKFRLDIFLLKYDMQNDPGRL